MPLPREDTRSLRLLWHDGRVAVHGRRGARCVYDLAERVYPNGPVASTTEFEDSWLFIGLRENGIANERHLLGYLTAVDLDAAARKRVIARNLKARRIVEVRAEGIPGASYALPEHLDQLSRVP